jgi:5'(3')-deoxyribonucleotidase
VTCYILTKAANEEAKQGKIDWLAKHVPMIDAEHFICITKGRKVDSMREEGILMDDDATNCKQWTKAGYMSIYLQDKGQDVVL